jgi:hypothetical protein
MAKKQSMTLEQALQVILAADGDNPLRQMLEWMGYRNGHRPRVFTPAVGDLDLLIPQDRDGTFSTALFERYQRSDKALALVSSVNYSWGRIDSLILLPKRSRCLIRLNDYPVCSGGHHILLPSPKITYSVLWFPELIV